MTDRDEAPEDETAQAAGEHDSAVEHGDSAEPDDDVDHDVTNPSNDPAENEVNRLLGGNFPLR